MPTDKRKNGDVVFICDSSPDARQVFLVGDFNQWKPNARRMIKTRDGTFRAKLKLAPGEYEYKFIIDGRWQTDPKVEQCTNPFGTLNNVAHVS